MAAIPLLPAVLLLADTGALGAIALLTLLLVQDVAFVLTAGCFARLKGRLRRWHFGLRATPPRRTLAIVVGATVALLGFEFGYIELLGVDETNVDDLTGEGALAVLALSPGRDRGGAGHRGAVLPRVLLPLAAHPSADLAGGVRRTAPCSGCCTSRALDTLVILPVIAVFGFGVCLVYEATGSVFAVIAIHAAFNTVASVDPDTTATLILPLAVGVGVLAACVLAAQRLGPGAVTLPAARPRMSRDRGAMALVLHSHMPYVEGFGTWPFGEEWLWEAVATVYLPLLDLLEGSGAAVTLGVTPVLCDQLETLPGEPGERLLALPVRHAPGRARGGLRGLEDTGHPELAAEVRRAARRLRARRGGAARWRPSTRWAAGGAG